MTLVDESRAHSKPAANAHEHGASARAPMPKGLRERAKDKVLGPALPNEALAHERLGRPTALAVFSSDALSSTAYATEEILKTLLAAGIGVAAFTKVLPITVAMVAVLAILMFSYRQTIKAYPSAGGAYIVTKDNLGLLPAQVAGVALLTDYVLTVAVSVSAGTAALYSAIPSTHAYRVPIALAFIALIALGNLRGVKESGKLFAAPTYGFVIAVLLIILVGLVKAATGNLHHVPPADPGLLLGTKSISLFLLLHAFASGGAAMTGVEAISNGVPAFKPPEWKNARSTLMVMGVLLGTMFLGLSWLASKMHVVPTGQKTVISQIARGVLGGGVPFFLVQLMTLLILVLAANTSFADFPRLASFHAEDAFMPRQLTKRGHRLGFSNGILFLAGTAAVLVVMFQASVDHLIPLYAIGVFTSFTLSQAGMAVRHLRLREEGWRLGLLINGGGAFATGLVTIIIAITKFTHGAWAVMLLVPILVMVLVRLNHQYESEAEQLDAGVAEAIAAPVPASTMTVVMIDHLDTAAARALQVAKALRTDRTEAVHLAVDEQRAAKLFERWNAIRPKHLDLRIVYCPDRKLELGAQAYVGSLVDAGIHVNVIIPRLLHQRAWHRLLHDRTSESLAVALSKLPDVDVTFVPFHLGRGSVSEDPHTVAALLAKGDDGASIGQLEPRQVASFHGQVRELALHTGAQTTSLVATVADPTGAVDLQFLGQTSLGGLRIGSRVVAEGTPVLRDGRLTVLNPVWEFTEPNQH